MFILRRKSWLNIMQMECFITSIKFSSCTNFSFDLLNELALTPLVHAAYIVIAAMSHESHKKDMLKKMNKKKNKKNRTLSFSSYILQLELLRAHESNPFSINRVSGKRPRPSEVFHEFTWPSWELINHQPLRQWCLNHKVPWTLLVNVHRHKYRHTYTHRENGKDKGEKLIRLHLYLALRIKFQSGPMFTQA